MKPTTSSSRIEHELLSLEKSYMQAIQKQDTKRAQQLTDAKCIVAGAQGASLIDTAQLAKMMEKPNYTLDGFSLDDVKVQAVSDDVAVIAYTLHEELTVEGKRLSLDTINSSTWVKRGEGWKCALHTESIVGDPFGRDRSQSSAQTKEKDAANRGEPGAQDDRGAVNAKRVGGSNQEEASTADHSATTLRTSEVEPNTASNSARTNEKSMNEKSMKDSVSTPQPPKPSYGQQGQTQSTSKSTSEGKSRDEATKITQRASVQNDQSARQTQVDDDDEDTAAPQSLSEPTGPEGAQSASTAEVRETSREELVTQSPGKQDDQAANVFAPHSSPKK